MEHPLFYQYPALPNSREVIKPILFAALRLLLLFISLVQPSVVQANERQSDPDGCLVCHALEGLQFIDKKGVLRVASINKADYFSSLHGSVPCTDCHQMKTYPHEVKEGLVDCSTECHVNEPSKGEKFTHKPVVKEFLASTHGHGRVKDFEGGNRLEEDAEPDPSCRRCHSNTPYIIASQMEKFKTEFEHADAECGKCHVGEIWMNQFNGHILRRLIGSRWNKSDSNKSCTQCHGDYARMAKVKVDDPNADAPLIPAAKPGDPPSKKKIPVTYRWIHAAESYERTLHSRILVVGEEKGASCLDCHVNHDEHSHGHGILKDEDKKAATHPDQLNKTCGASGCHTYAKNSLNKGFVKTDVHDINQVHLPNISAILDPEKLTNVWHWGSMVLLLFAGVFGLSSVYWLIMVYPKSKKTANNIIGDERFEEVMLGRKPKKAPPKAPVAAPKAVVPPAVAVKEVLAPVVIDQTSPSAVKELIEEPSSINPVATQRPTVEVKMVGVSRIATESVPIMPAKEREDD
ncbi:MAG: hypothetical protein QX197_09190 [Methylococcaceae bacterium]